MAVRYDIGEGLTAIDHDVAPLLAGLPSTPGAICAVAQGLVMLPNLAAGFGILEERQAERSIHAVSDILRVLRQHDGRGVEQPRVESSRVVGTCRHFALLACAFLRHRAIPARCRAGFASYFVPGAVVDHWVVEYRHPVEPRWVRLDPEILGFGSSPHPMPSPKASSSPAAKPGSDAGRVGRIRRPSASTGIRTRSLLHARRVTRRRSPLYASHDLAVPAGLF